MDFHPIINTILIEDLYERKEIRKIYDHESWVKPYRTAKE